MDQKTMAKKGGNSTLQKYGKEHFSKMGKKGAESLKKKYGKDYFSKISKGLKMKGTKNDPTT